jgi:hypothetical protein
MLGTVSPGAMSTGSDACCEAHCEFTAGETILQQQQLAKRRSRMCARKRYPRLADSSVTRQCSHMNCRERCGACCTAPSITSPIPGMPDGKPAGVPCVQLDELQRCRLFGQPTRPQVCASLQPSVTMCGVNREQALQRLTWLEEQTRPDTAE